MRLSASLLLLAVPAMLFNLSCGAGQQSSKATHPMGEKVQLGPLLYNVLEADWVTEIGEGADLRQAQKRFLVVRVSIENVGNKELTLPLFHAENLKGEHFLEIDNAKGLPDWLGLIRTVSPTATIQGRAIFDIDPGVYKLRLTDAGEPGEERMAYVELPGTIRGASGAPVQ